MPSSVHLIPRNRLKWIPKKLQLAHEYSFFLHDESARALVQYEGAQAHTVEVDFVDQNQAERFEILTRDLDPIAAMRAIGYADHARRVIINQITMAMVADCLHHIYEALRCLEKRKVVVALNLLRKPLTDNLLYLSWMFGDEDAFFEAFSNQSPHGLTPKLLGNKRAEIISAALQKTEIASVIDAEFIVKTLFDKSNEYGLQKLFQHAVHLITVDRIELRTSQENFNFIFKKSTDNDLYELLYDLLPSILLYLSHIIIGLFERMHPPEGGSKRAFETRSILGFYLAEEEGNELCVVEMLNDLSATICQNCKNPLNLTIHNAARIVMTETFRCTRCRLVSDFPFSWMFES